LIIGITGKRDLQGKDAAVGAAFRELFELLDERFSHTPKILLTALAKGADTIAAEEALAHAERQRNSSPRGCAWKVAVVLPMPIEHYEKDFDAAGKEKLRDLCSRVRSEPLDPLHQPEFLDPLHRPDPTSRFAMGTPFTWEELALGNGNPHRADHYEQVGLHISDQCGLLIAVMPRCEKPGKIGGTARIVDYRVKAKPDQTCRDIARRSQVLAPLPLDRSQPGPAWVIDLDGLDTAEKPKLGAVELWEPVTGHEYAESEQASEPAKHPIAIRKTPLTRDGPEFERLWLASAIETFNVRLARRERGQGGTLPENRSASDILNELRDELSSEQGRDKNRLTKTVFRLAALFVVAIVILEVHIEFAVTSAIIFYVVLFTVILALYGYGRSRRYQQYTEDYRAVAEALRVQAAWWGAGLSGREHRVDRTYLGATGGSIGRVRTAVRHLIDSALLAGSPPRPSPGTAEDWIIEQIEYFGDRIGKRHRRLSLVEDASWFLFVGSLGIALFVALAASGQITEALVESISWGSPGRVLFDSAVIAAGLFFAHRDVASFARSATLSVRRRRSVNMVNAVIAILAGFVISVGLHEAAVLAHDAGCPFASDTGVFAHRLTLIVMVAAAAVAGAYRFYAEKMSEEHELFSYRDALVTFRRAQEDLKETEGDASEAAKDRRNDILLAIGKEALKENEAWIRAHRLRPLEPLVGG
jgi:Ca2+/Na+ antiporter